MDETVRVRIEFDVEKDDPWLDNSQEDGIATEAKNVIAKVKLGNNMTITRADR